MRKGAFIATILILFITFALVIRIGLAPPRRPNISITFRGDTNKSAGARVGIFAVSNHEPSRLIMPRTLDQILADFAALKPSDFDNEAEGVHKLYGLTDELMALPQPERAIPALFGVMERMPDTEMGSPGPLVHTLEQMRGHYEQELVESIKRQPTSLTVWMVNRILNVTRDSRQRQIYLDLLRVAAEHPAAPESVRDEAKDFIRRHTRGA